MGRRRRGRQQLRARRRHQGARHRAALPRQAADDRPEAAPRPGRRRSRSPTTCPAPSATSTRCSASCAKPWSGCRIRICVNCSQSFLDDETIAARFKTAPAAKTLHHAFIGGLLEHVVSLLNLARLTAGNYAFIDLELLQTGVILHDMGKIEELSYERAFGYTNEGQLLGHIIIVLRMLDQKVRADSRTSRRAGRCWSST